MPGLFVLKSFIIVFAVLVALQGIAIALRAVLVLADCEVLLPDALRYPARVATALQTPGEAKGADPQGGAG